MHSCMRARSQSFHAVKHTLLLKNSQNAMDLFKVMLHIDGFEFQITAKPVRDKQNLFIGAWRAHRPQLCFFFALWIVWIMPTIECNVSLNQNIATSKEKKMNSIGLQEHEACVHMCAHVCTCATLCVVTASRVQGTRISSTKPQSACSCEATARSSSKAHRSAVAWYIVLQTALCHKCGHSAVNNSLQSRFFKGRLRNVARRVHSLQRVLWWWRRCGSHNEDDR